MNEPLISVIIPVYNTAAYLERCISSITENTYRELEIICVNDGSTDHSLEILDRLAEQDDRIRVISQPNGGISAARNRGIDAATGEYIAYIDSDDWVSRFYFEHLLRLSLEHKADVSSVGRRFSYDRDFGREETTESSVSEVLTTDAAGAQRIGLLRSFVTGKLYRAMAVQGLRFQDTPACEDTVCNAMLASNTAGVKYAYTEEPLYHYYQGNMNSIVKQSTVDTYRLQAKWFVEHMHLFDHTDYAIGYAFKAVFLYRYASFLKNTSSAFRKQSRMLLKKCLEQLRKNRSIPASTRSCYLLFSFFPVLYRIQLCIRDDSYLSLEKERWKRKKTALCEENDYDT